MDQTEYVMDNYLSQVSSAKHAVLRLWAVEALARSGGAQVIEPLSRALNDTSPVVCRAAVNALGEIGDERAVEPLGALFDSLSRQPSFPRGHVDFIRVRRTVVAALGQIGGARATKIVARALTDENCSVRMKAAVVLGQIGRRDSLPLLRARLSVLIGERDREVVSSIRAAIASI